MSPEHDTSTESVDYTYTPSTNAIDNRVCPTHKNIVARYVKRRYINSQTLYDTGMCQNHKNS